MGALMDALGYAGQALSAPGDYTRGLLAGSPGERVTGRDLLRKYGLASEDDTAANFLGGMATDVLTDPLTYAGGMLGGAAAKGLRGMIPAAVAEGSAAGRLAGEGLAGAAKFKEPLREVATISKVTPLAMNQAAEGVPGRAFSAMTSSGKMGAEMSGRTAAQMGRSEAAARLADTAALTAMEQGQALPEHMRQNVLALFDPRTNTIVGPQAGTPADLTNTAMRHERVHAIIKNAARGAGDANDLPAMMRLPAKALREGNPDWLRQVGTIGDELAAQTLENRTAMGQLKGAASFLFHPEKNAIYADLFARNGLSPAVARAYGYLPRGLVHAGAAGGAGGNALLQALLGGAQSEE